MRKYAVVMIVVMLLLLVSMKGNKYKYWSYYIRRKWVVFWRSMLRSLKRSFSSFQEQDYIRDENHDPHYEEGSQRS